MKTPSLATLIAANRLGRAGRVAGATAAVQRILQGKDAAQAADGRPSSIVASALRSFVDQGLAGRFRPLPDLPHAFRTDAPVAPRGARFLAAKFTNEAGTREYKLYVPSGYDGQPVPLVVMLHGCTQSPDDFAAGTGMNEAAEENTCLVVYPGQTSAANTSKCWNWFSADEQQRDRGEPSLIAGITREIMRQYSVDPRRVYIAGLSAGGAAAATMGATYPDLYAAIGVHSGLACWAASDLPSALATMRQGPSAPGCRPSGSPGPGQGRRGVPTIVFHGDQDTTVHPRNGDAVIAQSAAGVPLAKRVEEGRVPGGHAYRRTLHADPNRGIVLEHWLIHGAGHAWAGGSAAGSYTDPRGPDATREILRFFLEHPHPSGTQG